MDKIVKKTPSSNRKEKVFELPEFQFEMEENDITISRLAHERSAQLISFQVFRQEEEALRLKSRGLWLKAGDKKSAFFHRQCRARLSRNHISEISTAEGDIITGNANLKQVARNHFQLLL